VARRFAFRLQTVLNVRQMREREAQRDVAAKSAEIARVDRLNEQTADEIIRQQAMLVEAQQRGGLDPVELQRGRAWIAHLRKTIATRQMQKAEFQEQLRDLQTRLRDARTQTRIIEKLRERRWGEYSRDRRRREQAESDELARQLQDFDRT
jgi:flagellar FliJ protein